jgi:arginase
MASSTLRLTVPQWQGGNEPAYHFGARLLDWLAPLHDGPEVTIDVPEPDGTSLENEDGITGRTPLLAQVHATREAIDAHDSDRIVALGGDCLIDLAPIAYLNETSDGELGVLWIDAHPDVMRPEDTSHAHAHVLGMLLDEGDPDFTAEVDTPIDPNRVMYAGLNDWLETEDEIISRLGLQHVSATELADDSKLVFDSFRWCAFSLT